MSKSVVVTGIGLVSPVEPFSGIDKFWAGLISGEDTVKPMKAPLMQFGQTWPMAAINAGSLPPIQKFECIASKALQMALSDAGISKNNDSGLVFGTVLGNILSKEYRMLNLSDHSGFDIDKDKESISYPAKNIASEFGLKGKVITVSTACASGTDAIGLAARMIASDVSDIMIAGGADVISDFAISGFNALGALTQDKVRPFDRKRTGLALGEGAAFIVLESIERAKARKARIYGEILGYATISDANHLTGPHREGRGLADAIVQALANARLSPEEIGYINAHGTGTVYNDLMETKAVKKVFSDSAYDVPISSIKSMIGHSFGAAGVIEAICCLLAINTGVIPGTINLGEPDPQCDLYYVPGESIYRKIDCAISQSAGFGGQNSVLVIGR